MRRTSRVAGVGQSVGTDIPPEVGVEIHSGIPGWTELQPGEWENVDSGISFHRYYKVLEPDAFDLSVCTWLVDENGNQTWICPDSAFTGVKAPAVQPVEPSSPVTVTPVQPAQPVVTTVTANNQPSVPQPTTATSSGNWLWLLLLLLVALTMNDKQHQ